MKYKNRDFLEEEFIDKKKGIMQVTEEIGCTYITLKNWCKKLGVPILTPKQREIKENEEKIINLYVDERLLESEICDKLDVSSYMIRKALENNDIEKRSKQESEEIKRSRETYKDSRKYNLNEEYFDTWSNNTAYILGLIASDGAILKSKKSYSRWKIGLKDEDSNRRLLEDIMKEIEYNGVIYNSVSNLNGVNHKVVTLSINSLKMVKKLFEHGITNRKSFHTEMPKTIPLEFEMSFIRGYFDGDGSIEITYPTNKHKIRTKTPQLRMRIVSGCREILEEFSKTINKHDKEIPVKKVHQRKENLYELEYSTFHSIKIYYMMYKEDSLSLGRKRVKFEECINLRNVSNM